jgi:hypothetical protein
LILWLDLETASTVPIKAGAYRYSEGARILVQAYAVDDGPVSAEPFDAAVLQPLIDSADIVVAHNGGLFDRVQLARHGVTIPVEKLHDTMAIAYQHSLPGSLDALAGVFRLQTSKDKDGKRLIRLFCVPNKKGGFATPETHPEDWRKFLDYAKTDIEVMRQLYAKLPRWNLTPFERRVWAADQAVNDRGLGVDVDLAKAAIAAVDAAQAQLAERASDLTLGVVGSATQRNALLSYMNEAYDLGLEDLRGATVEKALERDDLPAELRELLVVRSQASTTSTAKYRALLDCVCADGRLRGLKQYCGASRTGRWAGRLWQPDNLPRSSIAGLKGEALQEAIEIGIKALKAGCADLLFDNVMELTSAALRGLIVPRDGRTLAVADLNAIEGRVLAWLAGEQWKLDAYARGEDLYKATAGRILGKKPEDIDDDERQQVGKVSELACFGPETLVLTNEGYTPICRITTRHQLWDGRNWVTHQGVLYKGDRKTINLAGVRVTAEHLIATPQTWRPASELASSESIFSLALATGSESLPSWELSARATASRHLTPYGSSARAVRRLISSMNPISVKAGALGVIHALKRRLGIGGRTTGVTPVLCLTTPTAGAYAIAYLRVSIGVTTPTTLAIPTTAGAASRCTNLGAPTAGVSLRISPLLMAGITRLLISTASMLTEVMNPKTSASSPAGRTRTTSGRLETCSNASQSSKQKSPVFDIYQSGPNNCFTVLSDRGPLLVHNCGFQGGVGAFVTFATAYNLSLEVIADRARETLPRAIVEESGSGWEWALEQEMDTRGLTRETWVGIDAIKRAWRAAHPKIARFWRDLEDAARAAIENPGDEYKAGRVTFFRNAAWLRMVLPSGRSLCYPAATNGEDAITFMGTNQFTRRFERVQTYGGKLAENATQAVARDILAHGLVLAEERGYEPVMHVHDEIIAENCTAAELSEVMSIAPDWAEGLPLAAKGFDCARYRK